MKYIKSLPAVFFLAIILVGVTWLLTDKCGRKAPDHSATEAVLKAEKRLRDSIHAAGQKADETAKADSSKWKRKADSAITELKIAKQLLSRSQAKTLELAAKVEHAKKNKDTAGYVTNCDDLVGQVIAQNIEIENYKAKVDSVTKAKDSVEQVAQRRLQEKDRLYNELRASTLRLDQECSQALTDYKKAAKRADKKYAIGIGGAAGITSFGTPGGAIGLTVSRIIIRL